MITADGINYYSVSEIMNTVMILSFVFGLGFYGILAFVERLLK